MSILLSDNELYKLHQRSKWNDEKGDWAIPHFTFNPKSKDLAFPTIHAKQRVDQQKEERDIAIEEEEEVDEAQFRKQGGFANKQKTDVKRRATDHTSDDSSQAEDSPTDGNNSLKNRDTSVKKAKNGGSVNSLTKPPIKGKEIIPERRRKYLEEN